MDLRLGLGGDLPLGVLVDHVAQSLGHDEPPVKVKELGARVHRRKNAKTSVHFMKQILREKSLCLLVIRLHFVGQGDQDVRIENGSQHEIRTFANFRVIAPKL